MMTESVKRAIGYHLWTQIDDRSDRLILIYYIAIHVHVNIDVVNIFHLCGAACMYYCLDTWTGSFNYSEKATFHLCNAMMAFSRTRRHAITRERLRNSGLGTTESTFRFRRYEAGW